MLKEAIVGYFNEFLSEYCEGLDVSQVTLSLWAGDMTLTEVRLKPTALESSLGIPVCIKAGKIGKLVTKIPWASLFRSPVEITIQNLHVLLTPSYGAYDQATEERISMLLKKNLVHRLEDHYKAYMLSQSAQPSTSSSTSYTEHYGMQIARNIQLRVQSVHVRYEDKVLRPSQPFSIGIVIKSLRLETTDQAWKTTYVSQNVETAYKLGTVEGFGVYWNRGGRFFSTGSDVSVSGVLKTLKDTTNSDVALNSFSYLIGPIQAEMKIILTPRPQRADFRHPILSLSVNITELSAGISRDQIENLLQLAEILEYVARKQRYKRFKPGSISSYSGNYRHWWKFAYNCVVEDIRKRKSWWSWTYMKEHREKFRSYMHSYSKKLIAKHPNQELEAELDALEKDLDIFSIILARKLASMHHTRVQTVAAKKSTWSITHWFSGRSGAMSDEANRAAQEEWTAEEKAEIFRAVDFDNQRIVVDYPADFESYRIHLRIQEVNFVITETTPSNPDRILLRLKATDFEASVALRPVNDGLVINLVLGSVDVRGLMDKPHIIASKKLKLNSAIFEFTLENRPLHSSAGMRLRILAQPLQILYHYRTVKKLMNLLAEKPQVEFTELRAAASNLLESEDVIASNVLDLVRNRDEVDVAIEMYAPYVLIPHGGALTRSSNILVVDLGSLKMKSLARTHAASSTSLPAFTYDKYGLEFSDFQIFLALPGENYGEKSLRRANYLLRYQQMNMTMKRSLSGPYKHLPGIVVDIHLPTLDVDISQHRFIQLIKLLKDLPIPSTAGSLSSRASEALVGVSSKMNLTPDLTLLSESEVHKSYKFDGAHPLTDAVINVHVNSVKVELNQGTEKHLIVELLGAVAQVRAKTYSTEVDASVTGVMVSVAGQTITGGTAKPLFVINSTEGPELEAAEALNSPLAIVKVLTVADACPRKFLPPVETFVTLRATNIDLMCHQEALSTLINYGLGFAYDDVISLATSSDSSSPGEVIVRVSRARVKTKLLFYFDGFNIHLVKDTRKFATVEATNLHVSYEESAAHDSVRVTLGSLTISPVGINSAYEKILLVEGDTAADLIVVLYNPMRMPVGYVGPNIKIELVAGSPFFVLLPSFVRDVKGFILRTLHTLEHPNAIFSGRLDTNDESGPRDPARLAVFVKMESPRIALLDDDASPEAIVINLGKISIQNEVKAAAGANVIVDELQFSFKEAKVSRIFINFSKQASSAEVSILNPISLGFTLSRTLSSEDRRVTNTSVTINIDDNVVHLDTRDYQIFKRACEVIFVNDAPERRNGALFASKKVSTAVETDNHVKFDLKVYLQRLQAVIYGKAVALAGAEGVLERDTATKLAIFSLHQIQANLTLWTNHDVVASLVVAEIGIADARIGVPGDAQQIVRQRSHTVPSRSSVRANPNQILKLVFKNGAVRDPFESNVHLDLSALTVSMSTDFVVELLKFFS